MKGDGPICKKHPHLRGQGRAVWDKPGFRSHRYVVGLRVLVDVIHRHWRQVGQPEIVDKPRLDKQRSYEF